MKLSWLRCAVVWLALSGAAFGQPAAPAGQAPAPAPSADAPAPAKPAEAAPVARIFDPQKQCVKDNEFANELRSGVRPAGDAIVVDTNFLPANQQISVGVRTAFVDRTRYFAAVEPNGGKPDILTRQDVVTRRAVASDTLVKKRLLEADQTIVTLTIDDEDAGFWQKADLYLYTCGTNGSPARVSRINIRLSPYWYSLWACAIIVLIAYLWIALALRERQGKVLSYRQALNPVKLTAGSDGKGSLSKFQIFSFSLVVFGLILLFMLQTGMLSDLSATILALLGISGIGATIAKGTDNQKNTISPENRAWLLRKGWMPSAQKNADPSAASWRDFFTTDGEFDVYRYQSFIFGAVVIFSLIAAGVSQLSSFVIPETILGIVGLSQAVYIGGKLVTPTNVADINTAVSDLRERERKLREAATAAKKGKVETLDEATALLGHDAVNAYTDKAEDVAALFEAETGYVVPEEGKKPSIG